MTRSEALDNQAHGARAITDLAALGRSEGSIDFVRVPGISGLEVMDVQNVSRKWAYFHESYTFCVASRVEAFGEAPWRYRRRTYRMGFDRVQLMEPGEFHTNLTVAPRADFRVLMLAPSLVASLARSLGWERWSPLHLRTGQLGDGQVRGVLDALTALIVSHGDAERAEAGMRHLLQVLSDQRCFEIGFPSSPRRASHRVAMRARDIIHERWNRHISIDSLSEELGLPLSSLERVFTQTFGAPPRQYQNHLRIMRAKELLVDTTESVEAIARACGFNDRRYFTRLFHREFGSTPRRHRVDVGHRIMAEAHHSFQPSLAR